MEGVPIVLPDQWGVELEISPHTDAGGFAIDKENVGLPLVQDSLHQVSGVEA